MLHFTLDNIEGNDINQGTINERKIKLLASPKSPAKRDEYGCGMAIIPVGHTHEEHAHEMNEELIYVISGEGYGIIEGNKIDIAAGHIIAIDKKERHSFYNTGREELKLLWIYSPSGPEVRFLDD